ncbi:ATP-binding cassette domain-containing protein [Pseudonocardia kujensis]|uniref:ABC transporter ATP-binding protein n=1 Tax=Pseudonocardia kujensis TaxID=1128675 RepID=UPI001E564B8B|nr:ATP-binding cassette domain-containing protein [Pseudonocardia kujensis]MCE0766492.1 ATP-binding cassette domain-containing protein [Pseudonocardia kujensis]
MVRVEGVHKRYRNGPPVLAGVDLALAPGGPTVLAGGNGSGKSTLLRIVAGCALPSAGRVTGRPAVVGYLPDRFPAQLRLPADAYLRHLARIRGTRPDPGLLARFGFTGPRREPMAGLSKGNAQKVGLAQALGAGAGLVVLDEPWAGLDAAAADTLADVLGEASAGTTVLVTDHTGRAARLAGARHLRLRDGRVEDAPAPTPVVPAVAIVLRCQDPEQVRHRLGVPGRVEDGRLHLRAVPSDSDPLLFTALRLGCSVESVGPA